MFLWKCCRDGVDGGVELGGDDNFSGGDNKNPRHPDNVSRKQWLIELEAQNFQNQLAS